MRPNLPWWARIGAKCLLSRVPVNYSFWQHLKLFRHGAMDRAGYACDVFEQHFARSGLSRGQAFVGLELGPGDSLASAVIAPAFGATHTWLVDVGPFAAPEPGVYAGVADELSRRGLTPPPIAGARDLAQLLAACHATYGTNGIASLRAIPTASVDFIWSHAVLEHVRRAQFVDYMRETRRVLKPTGIASHEVDLRDHLGGALNNLRIPSRTWEAEWMARSGFYTNRLSRDEVIEAMRAAGLALDIVHEQRWDVLPTPTRKFAAEFRSGDPRARLVSVFGVLARPA